MRIGLNHTGDRLFARNLARTPHKDDDIRDNWVPNVLDPNEVADDDLNPGRALAQPEEDLHFGFPAAGINFVDDYSGKIVLDGDSGISLGSPDDSGKALDDDRPLEINNDTSDSETTTPILSGDHGISLGNPNDSGIALDDGSGNASDSEYDSVLRELIKPDGILNEFRDEEGVLNIGSDRAVSLARSIERIFQLTKEGSIDPRKLVESSTIDDIIGLILEVKSAELRDINGNLSHQFLTSD